MKIGEYFTGNKEEISSFLISLSLPEIIIINDKVVNVCQNINHLTHGQWCEVLDAISECVNDYQLITKLLTIFHWSDITQEPFKLYKDGCKKSTIDKIDIAFGYPVAMHYIKLITKQAEFEVKQLSSKLNDDEIKAGYDKLTSFSDFGTRCLLAKEFGCFPDDILERNHREIVFYLIYNKIKSECDKEYSQILMKKNERDTTKNY